MNWAGALPVTTCGLKSQHITRFPIRALERNKDLTISVKDDRRRIYGVEGAVDYLIPDTDWSTVCVNFNVLKTESKVNGQWQKYDVKESSPSKATAYISWAPEPWSLRVQSTTSFDVSDAEGNDINGYTTVDFISSLAASGGNTQLQR